MSRISRIRSASIVLAAAAATACTVGRDYEPTKFDAPQQWQQNADSTLTADATVDGPWWQTFGDTQLDELVGRALAQNLDLRAAFARLQSARALRGVAEADALPSLDARGGYEHRRESRNTPFGAFIPQTDIHTIAVDASWELDLWGRVRRSVEAASGELDASAADTEAAAITVAAEVVSAYVDLRAAQQRLKIARSNLALQGQTQSLVEARVGAGLSVERDAAQARTNVESTRARVPSLEASASAAENRLCVLLGCAPGALPVQLAGDAPIPTAPLRIAVGVPADLLRRRPDVRAAELRFAAAVARIGADVFGVGSPQAGEFVCTVLFPFFGFLCATFRRQLRGVLFPRFHGPAGAGPDGEADGERGGPDLERWQDHGAPLDSTYALKTDPANSVTGAVAAAMIAATSTPGLSLASA